MVVPESQKENWRKSPEQKIWKDNPKLHYKDLKFRTDLQTHLEFSQKVPKEKDSFLLERLQNLYYQEIWKDLEVT